MSVRLDWKGDIPDEVRSAFEPHLLRWLYLLPTWCHELLLRWDTDDSDADLDCFAVMEYRWARLTIRPSWLSRSEQDRSEEVLHELLHVHMEPVKNVMLAMIAQIKEKVPDVAPWAEEQRRYAEETTICDLTRAILGGEASLTHRGPATALQGPASGNGATARFSGVR